jgi:hypothetical protein
MYCINVGVDVHARTVQEATAYLEKRFEGVVASVAHCEKEDLDMLNHLSGSKASFVKMSFRTVASLMDVRKQLLPVVERNRRVNGERDAAGRGHGV